MSEAEHYRPVTEEEDEKTQLGVLDGFGMYCLCGEHMYMWRTEDECEYCGRKWRVELKLLVDDSNVERNG